MKRKPSKQPLRNILGALIVIIGWGIACYAAGSCHSSIQGAKPEWNPKEIVFLTAPPLAGKSDLEKDARDDCPGESVSRPPYYFACRP
jgi:hypothetical protein